LRRLILWPQISRRIGACGLTRAGLVKFLTDLRHHLENSYPIFRSLRDQDDPRYFTYLASLADGELLHQFEFTIDDSTSPQDLFVIDFEHETRPRRR
jgi:hypothetical protein